MVNQKNQCNAEADKISDKRIELLNHMRVELPHYKDMLDFFESIYKERKKYMEALASGVDIHLADDHIYEMKIREGFPLLTKNDIACNTSIINDYFLNLLNRMKEQSAENIELVEALIDRNEGFRFEAMIDNDFNKMQTVPDNALIDFLISETLGPLLEIYAAKIKNRVNLKAWTNPYCPICGKKPAFAMLKSDDGKRILVCSTCSTQWEFKRIQCTFCGTEDQKLLSYLVVENEDMYRIETCDACQCYLKTIVLKNATHEIFYDIESIITLHLDMVAVDKGYTNTYSSK